MIDKKVLKELLIKYEIEQIEIYLIQKYLDLKQLNYQTSSILKQYLTGVSIPISSYCKNLRIDSLKILENYLELLIPANDRKLNGAFFTPSYVVDFIIKELSPTKTDKCLDSACGTGAFLVALADFYKKKYGKSIKKTVQENIFGSDILAYNIRRAKILLAILALEHGEYLEESDFNLYVQDSLRSKWQEKFEIIVGNPPYVKYQDLSAENRAFLLNKWQTIKSGTFNLYFAFFELGYDLLKENGKLGYITPNNYFTSLAAKQLRSFFMQNKCVHRIIDFSHKKVFDAQTYTAITFLNKKENDTILYDRIKNEESPLQFVAKANGSPNYIADLNAKKWRLLKTDEQQNIKVIEKIGTPIKELFDICVGIATLKDSVFFVDINLADEEYIYKSTTVGDFRIEKAITKPVFKISDFKTQAYIPNNKRRIIFPYHINEKGQAQAIAEADFSSKYPECYKYLLSQKALLQSRDKGKGNFEPFYVWGRTQGLTRKGKKILNPTFSKYPRFLLVNDEEAFFTNGYGIYFKNQQTNRANLFATQKHLLMLESNIDVVQKILNSYVMHYYVSKTSVSIAGGYPCYQKNFIEKFTIPSMSQKEISQLRKMQNQEDIDAFLIKKYGLKLKKENVVI